MSATRSDERSGGHSPPLRLFVSIASTPPRLHLVRGAIDSLLAQSLPPDKVLLVLPHVFSRWPTLTANVSLVGEPHPRLEIRRCDRDDGPGTKTLCALPRVLELLAQSRHANHDNNKKPNHLHAHPPHAALILADDDRQYRPTALALMRDAFLRQRPPLSRALSFQAYTLPLSGRSAEDDPLTDPTKDNPTQPTAIRNLTVGQGADLFAIPIVGSLWHSPTSIRKFYELAMAVDDRFRLHDDVWTSMYLTDAARLTVCPVTVLTGRCFPKCDDNYRNGSVAVKAPPQFLGPVHGPKETWATALRRLGGNTTRHNLNRALGLKRVPLRWRAIEAGLVEPGEALACES